MPHRERLGDLARQLRHAQRLGRANFRWRNLITFVAILGFFVATLALEWGAPFLLLIALSLLLIGTVHVLGPWLERRTHHSDSRTARH